MLRGLVLAEPEWLAVAASAAATGCAMVVYAYDWARRKTLPHPVSWLIWDLVYAVLLTALWLRAARWSLVPLALILGGNLVITVLAVKRDTGQLGAGEKSLMACCALALGASCLVRDATAAAALAVSRRAGRSGADHGMRVAGPGCRVAAVVAVGGRSRAWPALPRLPRATPPPCSTCGPGS